MKNYIGGLICLMLFLTGCNYNDRLLADKKLNIELELTEDYDDHEPFIDERLFCVSEDIKSLTLNVSLQLDGENGILEIADNQTGEVLWDNSWQDVINNAKFDISLNKLKKDKEYVIRFTGSMIKYARIVVTCNSDIIKERERPMK
ncbi:MAG: DUF4624 family lipoprotein [Thomasclavelia sp.]|uniref:DUF4624 family lipoprotein n=1 Tax=Thomasclavelia sp. TaxID=3025757 RepID=UPI0039A0A68C